MILFHKDWAQYPGAIIDTATPNKSFLRISLLYRKMGIKNHAFMLALMDPSLQGVDPFNENLTQDQMQRIAIECRRNPWYYFREVARAPSLAGSDARYVEANRGNIALWWLFFNHVMTILLQPRQTGKSFSTDTLMVLLTNIVCRNTEINLLTKDDTLRRKNVIRIKNIMNELPAYLLQRTKKDTDNTEEITIGRLGNIYTTHVPQASEKAAFKVGRGLTSPIFHVDEPPFQSNIAIALPAALSAGGAARDIAREAGTPYGTILTTTAGNRSDKDGKYVYKLIMESAEWTEHFLDAEDVEELEKLIRTNSRSGDSGEIGKRGGVFRVQMAFSHRQLGKTDDWLRQQIEEAVSEGDQTLMDFFVQWVAGTATGPFDIATAERIEQSKREPSFIDIMKPHGYCLRWYLEESIVNTRLTNETMVCGIDTSDAVGGDDISLVITSIRDLSVIAAGNFNETNIIKFAEWLVYLKLRFKNLVFIIERRSTGSSVIDYLLLMLPRHGIDPFKTLFNLVVNEADEKRDRFKEITNGGGTRDEILVKHKKHFGFATSGSGYASRDELYSTTLRNAVRQAGDKMHDKQLVSQVTALVVKNGRIDHDVGMHDDMVIGFLLCMWLLLQGKNLHYYGINSSELLYDIKTRFKNDTSDEDLVKQYEQGRIRERITALYEELQKENNEFVIQRLELELRSLDEQLILEEGETFSVNELLDNVKNKRVESMRRMNTYSDRRDQWDFRSNYAPSYMRNPEMIQTDYVPTLSDFKSRYGFR